MTDILTAIGLTLVFSGLFLEYINHVKKNDKAN